MFDLVAYAAGVPQGEKNSHKREILADMVLGVAAAGGKTIMHQGRDMLPAKVAFIQGWVHAGSPNTPHLLIRKQVAEFQKKTGNRTLICDSTLFNYKDANKNKTYSRFSFDGVFPPTGNYFWDNPDPARWQQIGKDLGIPLKDWRNAGSHILICTQRNGGWSMKGLNVPKWLDQTVTLLRKYTDRPIIVRGHPGDKHARTYLDAKDKRYMLSTNPLITQDFSNAHAVITYNSSPGVAAAIEGIPCFVTDPTPEYSQAFPISNTDLFKIETPNMPDRQQWVEKLAMCHWNRDEIRSGAAWKHFRNFI